MSWYYADAGRQVGPISKADLEALFQSGSINPQTLVWTEGMPEWRAYGEVEGGGASAPPVAGDVTACSECGQVFPASEVIRHGNATICAGCKPVFLQRLREGAVLQTGLEYAGFWIRGAAIIIDSLILGAANFMIGAVLGIILGAAVQEVTGIQVLLFLVQVAIGLAYEVGFLGRFGATPGKMACGLKVVMPDGSPISYGRAFGRYLAKILSGLILAIGYLMAAFDDQKRTLHDRICHTRVIRAR